MMTPKPELEPRTGQPRANAARERLRSLLRAAARLPAEEAVVLLWADQHESWARGERVLVEEYLAAAEAPVGSELVLDLIYGEWHVRSERGLLPESREYAARFPQFADQLRRQFDFEAAASSLAVQANQATVDMPGPSRSPVPDRELAEPGECPTHIGKYRIIGRLDAGSQAEVFRAVHPGLQRDVVVKLARQAFPDDALQRERLPAEGRMLAELDHPGLARVFDLDVYQGRPFLVMEYVRGVNLDQYARQRRPPPTEAACVVAQIARALAAAHRRGVLHLDIKPKNILIDETGQPRLIDFGLARIEHAWTHPTPDGEGISGTIPYMSPEQARGEHERLTPQSDLFSLGGVLFFLLTGEPPLSDESVNGLLARARQGTWSRRLLDQPHIPPALRDICTRAMAVDPSERYATAEELAGALESSERRSPWTRHPVAAGVLAAMCVATLLGAWWGSQRARDTARPTQTDFGLPANAPEMQSVPVSRLTLNVSVGPRDASGRGFRNLRDSLPLRTGDELIVQAEIPAACHAALASFNNAEGLRVLGRIAPGDTVRTLRFPERQSQVAPLEGPPGTEFLIVCVRRDRALDLPELQQCWGETSDWPSLPGAICLTLRPEALKLLQAKRGLGSPRDRTDPANAVLDRLARVGERLQTVCDDFEILAFAHEGTQSALK